MNCQDIMRILDDRDIGALGEAERREVAAHLAACPDCARDWEIHQRLSAAAIPPMPAEFAAQCRALVAARPAPASGRRASSRLILIGTLAAVAAAAAMLAVRLTGPRQPVGVTMSAPATIRTAAMESTGLEHPTETRPIDRTGGSGDIAARPAESVKPFTVLARLRLAADDPALRRVLQVHYAQLLDQLRAVPGLQLLESEQSGNDADAQADYLITLTGGDGGTPGASSAFGATPIAAQAGAGTSASAAPRAFLVTLKVESLQRDARTGRTGMTGFYSYSGYPDPKCDGAADSCPTAAASGTIVELLRATVFPVDPSLQPELQARLLDPGLNDAARLNALSGVVQLIRAKRGTGWNADLVRGAMDLAVTARDPVMRAQVWRTLRSIDYPGLVQPLFDMIRQESDVSSRLEAVATLAEYGRDPAGSAALESIASSDSRQLVREVARRALAGDAGWNQYVAATLTNSSLTDAERLEPFNYLIQSAALMGAHNGIGPIVNDQVMAALKELLPKTWGRSTDTMSRIGLANLLRDVDHPVAAELLLKSLLDSQDPMVRRSTLSALAPRCGYPRVRAAVEQIAAGDPDPQMRQIAAGALQASTAPDPNAAGTAQFQLQKPADPQGAPTNPAQ